MNLEIVPLASLPAFAAVVSMRLVCRARWFGYWRQTEETASERVPKGKTTVVLSSVIPVVQSQRGGQKCALPGEPITYRSIFPKSHLFLISPFHRLLEKDHHIQKSYKLLKKPFRPLKHTRKYLFAYSRNTILIKAAYQRSQLLSKFSIKKDKSPDVPVTQPEHWRKRGTKHS